LKTMKVLLINSLYHPVRYGGAERSVQYLAESLFDLGHDVVVVTLRPKKADPVGVTGGVKVIRLPLRNLYWPFDDKPRPAPLRKLWSAIDTYNPAMERALFEIIKREDPSIVHTNNLHGFSVAAWRAAKRNNKPILHTLRDYYLVCGRSTRWQVGGTCKATCLPCRPVLAMRGRCTPWVDGVAANSQFILDLHRDLGCFTQAKIRRAIHTPCPLAPHPRAFDIGVPGRKLVFGFLGRLHPIKGVNLLLRTFLQRPDYRWKLLIAGDGAPHYKNRLHALGKSGTQDGAIEFLGQSDADEFFERIDILCVPSLWEEPLSRAVIEAGARGIPVIASRRGGHPEVVEDGKTGLLFEPNEPRSLATAIDLFFEQPELMARLGAAAYVQAEARNPERIARQYDALYQSLVTA
jgi:glycosyltransferase involved in cell wall biosynthesis